jgi:hypothetical protein
MALAPSPLTSLSEEQRTQATSRFTIIRPALVVSTRSIRPTNEIYNSKVIATRKREH